VEARGAEDIRRDEGLAVMRIVLTANYSPWSRYVGGGQRSTHSLATALARRGHRVSVVYTRTPLERFPVPHSVEYRVRWAGFFGLRSRMEAPLRGLNVITVRSVVGRILEEEGADAVHGNGEEAALLPSLKRTHRFRLVITPRYPRYPEALLGHRGMLGVAVREPRYLLLGAAVRGADACCPTSRSAAGMVQAAYGPDPSRVRVIPNGVHEAYIARGHEWPGDGILFFGRLHESKGADTLLDALGILGAGAPTCTIVGRGEMEASLRRRAAGLGIADRVRFLPWKEPEALADLLARSALAVLPSRSESFGNTVAEAMAVGVPVISTTAGSVPEVVEHGRSGWLVPPGSARELAGAIRTLSSSPDLARSLGEAGRRRVLERFTWDAVASAFEEVYRGS